MKFQLTLILIGLSLLALAQSPIEIEMVEIPANNYTMGFIPEQKYGQTNEKPGHLVNLDGYYISIYEVTQLQWSTIMGENPSKNQGCDSCPVEQVSWNDVQIFINKLNALTGETYRLPTEAEWEYAAKGGHKGFFTKHAGSNDGNEVAWVYVEGATNSTKPVGSKTPNEVGIYDMSGNVWEWCSDWYGADYYTKSEDTNPIGPLSGETKVIRGGSWYNNIDYSQVTFRNHEDPNSRVFNLGFRLAKDL